MFTKAKRSFTSFVRFLLFETKTLVTMRVIVKMKICFNFCPIPRRLTHIVPGLCFGVVHDVRVRGGGGAEHSRLDLLPAVIRHRYRHSLHIRPRVLRRRHPQRFYKIKRLLVKTIKQWLLLGV